MDEKLSGVVKDEKGFKKHEKGREAKVSEASEPLSVTVETSRSGMFRSVSMPRSFAVTSWPPRSMRSVACGSAKPSKTGTWGKENEASDGPLQRAGRGKQ